MKKAFLSTIAIFLIVVGLFYMGASWYFSTVLIDSQTKAITAEKIADAEADLAPAGIPLPESVPIHSVGGITLTSYFFDNPQDADCGVVFLHGYTGTGYDLTAYMPMFWELGCELISYDARGHGDSSEVYHTFGYYERQDASAVVDWLAAETGLAPEQIGLLGISYGAATALQTLAERSDLAFIIADSSYQDYETIVSYQAGEQYGAWTRPLVSSAIAIAEWRADFEMNAVSPQDTIQNNQTPVLLIHAREDAYTFPSHSETIYAKANPANTMLEITDWGNGHSHSRKTRPEAYESIVYSFIDHYVPQFGQN